jgi:hypothetical protein
VSAAERWIEHVWAYIAYALAELPPLPLEHEPEDC